MELSRAATHAVGREVNFKTGVWEELKRDLAEGRIQALPLVGRTPEREALYDFTFPYLTMHGTIVVRNAFVEDLVEKSGIFVNGLGRPSVAPGAYFRMSMVGYFERLSSERGIA